VIHEIRDLPVGENAWITLIVGDGAAIRASGRLISLLATESCSSRNPMMNRLLSHLFERSEQRPYRDANEG
jgi:hypothetical protein